MSKSMLSIQSKKGKIAWTSRPLMGASTWTMYSKKRKNNLSSPAFSMIELILVMMLIGILSVIIVPKADNLITNMRLKAAGSKLIDDLTYIYDYAVTKHDTTWLVVNIAENSYGIFSGPSESEREFILDPSTNSQGFIDFDEEYSGIQITSVNFSGDVEFYYNWWGTPSSGGQIVLNNLKIIKVEPETGYVYETE